MLHQLLPQKIEPSEHTAGKRLIFLHTAISSKGCFEISWMKLQLHCSFFPSFLVMLKTVADNNNLYSLQKSGVSINTNKEELTLVHWLEYRSLWELFNFLIIGHIGLKIQEYLKSLIRYLLITSKNLGSIFILLIIFRKHLEWQTFQSKAITWCCKNRMRKNWTG